MAAVTKEYAHPERLYALVGLTTVAAAAVLFGLPWSVPDSGDAKFWNGLIAFALLSIACDTSFLKMSFANVNSSIAFVPFLASVILFPHPWPMIISGTTAVVVDSLVRRKAVIRVVFNTAQYMLAIGVGQFLYSNLGGPIGTVSFQLQLLPFILLVAAYFVANSGSVTLAISFSSGVSVRESWSRLIGGAFVYDVFSSSLGLLLAYLYIRLEFAGLAMLLLPLFFVRHIYEMNQQLELKNREQLNLMVRAMEARDPYTSGHSVRVSEYARAMARELGLSAKQVDNVETAALLHDVGKMYEEFVPLLRKEGKLTPEERRTMQTHPVRSSELVATSAGLRGEVERAIRHHHENFDGTGYPDGLAGESIPMSARIIMIADTLDAMTTDRPYRKALSFDRCVQELVKFSGAQFDPRLVRLVMNSATIRRLVDGPTAPRPLDLAFSERRTPALAGRAVVGQA